LDGVPDLGDELSADGEVERVDGTLTAIESLVDAREVFEAFEVVLSVKAASLGRGAEVVDAAGAAAVPLGALIFMRAASWLRDGSRLGWGFGCSGAVLMVVQSTIHRHQTYFGPITIIRKLCTASCRRLPLQ
jgi:hypothetical protein